MPESGGGPPLERELEFDDRVDNPDVVNLDAAQPDQTVPSDQQNDTFVQAVVKMKLSTFCKHEGIQRKLQSLVFRHNILMCQAYAFANLHILRLMAARQELPVIDRNFYFRCLSAVSLSTKDRKKSLDSSYNETIAVFEQSRQLSGQKPLNVTGLNQLLADNSITMATMATNHLWMNLDARLQRYLQWKVPHLKYYHNHIVRAVVYEGKQELDAFFSKVATAGRKRKRVTEKREASLPEAKEVCECLRGLLSQPLPKGRFANKAHWTLPLYAHILKETETQLAKDDIPKRKLRLFNLLPLKANYTSSYMPVSSMFLMDHILKSMKLETIKKNGRNDDPQIYWRKYFNVNLVETTDRRFGLRISTDGYAVSVLMHHKCSQSTGSRASDAKPDEIRELLQQLQDRDVQFVGIDPGFTDVVTMSMIDQSGQTQSRSFSSSDYYERAKVKRGIRLTKRWNEETKALTDLVTRGGSKTTDVQKLNQWLEPYLSSLQSLLDHRERKGYRRERFFRYIKKQAYVQSVCDAIAPKDVCMVVIGFGDWSGGSQSPVSRKHCGPIEDIKKELRKRENVMLRMIWEYKTSKLDSTTLQPLRNMKAFKTVRTKEGVKKVYSKIHKVLHCQNNEGHIHGQQTTWNRDINASLNILRLLRHEVNGDPRPQEFCKQK